MSLEALWHIRHSFKSTGLPEKTNKTALKATGLTILYSLHHLKASCAIKFGFNSKDALWKKTVPPCNFASKAPPCQTRKVILLKVGFYSSFYSAEMQN